MNPAAMRYQGDTVFLVFRGDLQYATTNNMFGHYLHQLTVRVHWKLMEAPITGPDSSWWNHTSTQTPAIDDYGHQPRPGPHAHETCPTCRGRLLRRIARRPGCT